MTDKKFVPSVLVDNTSTDPSDPNGTVLVKENVENIQTQYLKVAGVQELDALPDVPSPGENIAMLSSDHRPYLHDGSSWIRVLRAAEDLLADIDAARDVGTEALRYRDLHLSRNANIAGKASIGVAEISEQVDYGGTARYSIFKDADQVVCAKNGANGRIEHYGTAQEVLQAVLDEMDGGGEIRIANGTYDGLTGLTVPNGKFSIRGEGRNTILKLADGANNDLLTFTSQNFSSIADLALIGNSANNTSGRGIYMPNSFVSELRRLWVFDFMGGGVHLYRCNVVKLRDCQVDTNQGGGVYLEQTNKCSIMGGVVELNHDYGVKLDRAGSSDYGLNNVIDDVWFESSLAHTQTYDVLHESGYATRISNNLFARLSSGEDVISLGSGTIFATIDDNMATGIASGKYLVRMVDGVYGVKLRNNYPSDQSRIYDGGVRGYINDTPYAREGVATIASGQSSVVINHLVGGTPTHIMLSGSHAEVASLYYDTVGATRFTIRAPAAVTADRTVSWRARI